jgi:hypothetical protein
MSAVVLRRTTMLEESMSNTVMKFYDSIKGVSTLFETGFVTKFVVEPFLWLPKKKKTPSDTGRWLVCSKL